MARHARDRRAFVPTQRSVAPPSLSHADPAFRLPDPSELMWLEEARELLRGPRVDLTDVAWLCSQLDVLMESWHSCPPAARWNPVPTTTALGIAVGDAVIARAPGVHWVSAREPSGSQFALADSATAFLGRPIEAVDALWIAGRPGSLNTLVDSLTGRALNLADAPDEPARLTGALRLLGLRR